MIDIQRMSVNKKCIVGLSIVLGLVWVRFNFIQKYIQLQKNCKKKQKTAKKLQKNFKKNCKKTAKKTAKKSKKLIVLYS